MSFSVYVGLLGGLALFLYGMQMMSAGMEAAAGNRMKQILEKLTANRFLGVLVGAVITAVIQSSSATTVMVVGFVNSGMMTLRQAVWIIMGANIGTTITGQLIALDVGEIAPLIAFAGVVLIMMSKNQKVHHIGNILAGLGILFIGMDMMSTAMKPLAESEAFASILTRFENPILGILAGMVFTAIIQSSSASVGILQALANSGLIPFSSAVFVLFGQNIGTCITALLASIGTNRSARRATIIHISFNVIGTIVFTTLCLTTGIVDWVASWTPDKISAQIANMHTLFNITTTLLLLPFGGLLATLSEKILPEKDEENDTISLQYIQSVKNISEEKFGLSAIAMESTKNEIMRMLNMASENVNLSLSVFKKYDKKQLDEVDKKEEYIDFLNKEISKYISKIITHERTEEGSKIFNAYFAITSNIERIGDHAVNIAGYSNMLSDKKISFSDMAKEEIDEIQEVCQEVFDLLLQEKKDIVDWHGKVACMEQKIDDLTKEYQENMYKRIREGVCKDEGSILFSEMLTDFERIGDHALNIADEILKIRLAGNQ